MDRARAATADHATAAVSETRRPIAMRAKCRSRSTSTSAKRPNPATRASRAKAKSAAPAERVAAADEADAADAGAAEGNARDLTIVRDIVPVVTSWRQAHSVCRRDAALRPPGQARLKPAAVDRNGVQGGRARHHRLKPVAKTGRLKPAGTPLGAAGLLVAAFPSRGRWRSRLQPTGFCHQLQLVDRHRLFLFTSAGFSRAWTQACLTATRVRQTVSGPAGARISGTPMFPMTHYTNTCGALSKSALSG